MDFLDELSNDTTKVNADMAEMIRFNSRIAKEEQKIEDAYREIGRIYYKNYASKNNKLFRDQVTNIRESEALILTEVKQIITKLKGLVVCPSCGSGQPLDSIFCSVCGTRLSDNSGVQSVPVAGKAVVEAPVPQEPEEIPSEEKVTDEVVIPAVEPPVTEAPIAENPTYNIDNNVCKVCGTPMAEDMLFCINCGTRRS